MPDTNNSPAVSSTAPAPKMEKSMSTREKSMSTNLVPAAGYRSSQTNVRRMGDPNEYFYDGSWKASSF